MNRKETDRRRWPGWLEPLRPDGSARFRMRSAILRRAVPLLEARRWQPWWEVAAGWSRMLLPIAAVFVLFFGGLAYRASRTAPAGPALTLEELAQPTGSEDSFALLTGGTEPSADRVLSVVMNYER
ncbi:MAG: hypothetical protein ACE5HP_11420 [Gemmatimonadota bacterium]